MGHPSEKLSTDVPRVGWKVILISEILSPFALAVVLSVAYLFVKSFANPQIDALLRLAIIAIGPILFNAVLLIVLFIVSLFAGPMLGNCCGNFGSVMAAIAHVGSVIGMVAFFEFLWLLERYDISHAVLGMIATVSIQRCIIKIFISLFLTREFKHDETNRAWWTGRWYGRGLGSSAFSQPAREFVVKIVEMSLFAADFLCGHFLLFILTLPCLIPGLDILHSTMLFWLRPSKQIRSPIFSFKQRALRRAIIFKFGVLYACVFAFFVALIALPIIFKSSISLKNCSVCGEI